MLTKSIEFAFLQYLLFNNISLLIHERTEMIPAFGLGNVLPPFDDSDVVGAQNLPSSPYESSMSELVERFATSPERAQILKGFKGYRDELRGIGFEDGFQWVDGSFVEACEIQRGRPPEDLDVVSMLHRPIGRTGDREWIEFVNLYGNTLLESQYCKATFACDAYFIDLDIEAELIASQSAYWFGLFSHQRDTFRWKGLVQIALQCDDEDAMTLLNQKEQGW